MLTKRTPQTGPINDHCVPDVIDNQQLQKGPKIKNRNEKVIRDKLKIDLIRKRTYCSAFPYSLNFTANVAPTISDGKPYRWEKKRKNEINVRLCACVWQKMVKMLDSISTGRMFKILTIVAERPDPGKIFNTHAFSSFCISCVLCGKVE